MPSSSSPSVLIVRLDAIGDALVTVPLIAALRAAGRRVGAVLQPANAAAFSARAVNRVYLPYELEAIRADRYDIALIPSEEPAAYAIARDAAIRERIGFDHGLRGKPLKSFWIRRQCTRTVYRSAGLDTGGLHECEIVFGLGARLLGAAAPSRDAAFLRPMVVQNEPQGDGRIAFQVTQKWERLGAQCSDVADAALRLSREWEVRAIGAAFEAPYCERFERATGLKVEMFGALEPWKTAIAAARALAAPDSGAAHVAGMTGTPVAAAYASANFALQTARWSPWAAPHALVDLGAAQWPERMARAIAAAMSASAPA
ncbi:MAG: glycosyltransferase family 9 protein [Candidatus Baltobacteraceae bacterium]